MVNIRYHTTQEVTKQGHAQAPSQTADKIIEEKILVIHISDSSHNRSKCSDDGYKTGKNNSLPAIFLIISLGSFQMVFMKYQRVVFSKDPYPYFFTEGIAKIITQDSSGKG